MRYSEPDVVVVGAGIVGGTLGTVLARTGFEVATPCDRRRWTQLTYAQESRV
jgi:2-polyprenyl-6-methoxyphenol hydroxylase-like FAD-dependent oxidoreductase